MGGEAVAEGVCRVGRCDMDRAARMRGLVTRGVGVAVLVLMVPTTGACDGDAPSRRGDEATDVCP